MVAVLCDLVEFMKAPITSAQAMSHPAVVETINVLSELCRELREALETARADEREECAKLAETTVCDVHLPTGTKIYGSRVATAIRARGTTWKK